MSFDNVRKEIKISNQRFVIRSYTKDDYHKLALLLRDYYREVGGQFSDNYSEKRFNDDVERGKLLVLVAETDNQLIGFTIALELNKNDLILLDGYLVKNYRGKMITKFYYLFFKAVKSNNYERILSFPNEKSAGVLVRMGFDKLSDEESNIKEPPFYNYAISGKKLKSLQRKLFWVSLFK